MSCPTHFSLITKKSAPFFLSLFSPFCLSPQAEASAQLQRFTELVSAMEDDWDLHAVVRGCNATATTTISSSASFSASIAALTSQAFASDSPGSGFSTFSREETGQFFSVQDPFEERNNDEELHELYKPFFPKSPVTEQPRPIYSPATAVSQFSFPTASKAQIQQKQSHGASATAPRTKRRKNQMKNVCQVAAESLSSDIWAWRKYGQKPIKGSPYPRGYYRCSSSKGCLARKQVERNRSDPGMFIVTYTAEHNHPAPTHRNSLAGSTRQKTSTAASVSSSDQKKSESELPDFSSSPSLEDGGAPRSTTAESKEEKKDLAGDEEDEFGVSKMVLNDDFFVGFEELDSPPTGDSFYDNFPANLNVSWMVT